MKVSETGLEIIKEHEGLVLTPYLCPAGIPTIGYGNTYYEDGTRVKLTDAPITKLRAEHLLKHVLKNYEAGVNRYVQVYLNQNQFDAVVSFAYNLGLGALQRSTLLKRINNNPFDEDIYDQFLRWNRANGRILKGLKRRRKQEADLYFK